jgi:hypothetical protein
MKYDYTSWSPQLEEDCVKLTSEGEAEGDAILVAMARVSRLLVQTAELDRHLHDYPESCRHVSLHIGPLKSSLDVIRGALSDQQRQHSETFLTILYLLPTYLFPGGVIAYLYGAEISIYELAFSIHPNTPFQQSHILDHKRTDHFISCLQACKSCMEHDLTHDLLQITTPVKLLFSYCST